MLTLRSLMIAFAALAVSLTALSFPAQADTTTTVRFKAGRRERQLHWPHPRR